MNKVNNIPVILTPDYSGTMKGHPIAQSEAKKAYEELESLFANDKRPKEIFTSKCLKE